MVKGIFNRDQQEVPLSLEVLRGWQTCLPVKAGMGKSAGKKNGRGSFTELLEYEKMGASGGPGAGTFVVVAFPVATVIVYEISVRAIIY